MKYISLPIVLVLLFFSNAQGQVHQSCSSFAWGDVISSQQNLPINIPSTIHDKVNYLVGETEVQFKISIESNGVYPYGRGDNFLLEFTLSGDIVDNSNHSVLGSAINQSITLSPTEPEAIFVSRIGAPNRINFNGSKNPYNLSTNQLFDITNLLVTVTNSQGMTIPHAILKFEVCYNMDLKSSVGTGVNTSMVYSTVNLNSIPTLVPSSGYYKFEWNSNHVYYPNYEFQLLKLENTILDRPANNQELQTEVDWNQALSFVIPEEKLAQTNGIYSLHFKPSEGTGYYLWRIKPIGNYYDGGVANNQNWGSWNTPLYTAAYLAGTNTISLSSASLVYNDCFFYTDVDEDNNYIYSRTFTEDGQVYESMTYADKLLRPRQTQSYLPAEDKTLIGQSLYDHLGRSSISVIPVPVDGKMNGYKENFVQNQGGDLYVQEDYARDNKVYDPSKISTNGAYSYYSPNNPDITIPDAEGYPFTRTLYSNDGLNRVIEQSGIGQKHMVGPISSGRGRTTKTNIQVSVDDAELVSIFGIEAPNANHVTKQIVIDPNGTTSVTYLSKTGKVLATALAAAYDPEGTYPLTELDNSTSNDLVITESLDLGSYQGGRFISNKEIELVQSVGNLQFEYQSPGCGVGGQFPPCLSGQNCSYEVKIKVVKFLIDPNDPLFDMLNQNVTQEVVYSNETTPLIVPTCTTQTVTTGVALERGTYMIIKEVKPLGTSIQDAINTYQVQVENEIITYMNLIGLLLDQVSSESDWVYVQQAVDEVNNYMTHQNTTTLATNLDAISLFSGVLTGFAFSDLTFYSVKSLSYDDGQTSTAGAFEVDKITLKLEDCYGNETTIASEVEAKKEKFRITRSDYTYNGIGYDYPPFLEYFLEEIGLEIYNDASQPNSIFADFFDGYKYWNGSQWTQIDENFVFAYINASSTNDYKVLNANQFNRMVWHMFNDKYYGGQVRYVGSADPDNISGSDEYQYYDASSNTWLQYVNSSLVDYQYDVEELKSCWENVFGVMKKMLDPDVQNAINNGISSHSTDPDGSINNSNAGAGSYQDEMNKRIPWIIKFFFGDSLEDQMTNDQNNGGVQPVFSSIPLSAKHLPKQFLECTGYKYARIIDPAFGGTSDYSNYVSTLPANRQHGTVANISFNTYDMPLSGTPSISSGGYLGIPGYADEMAEYYGTNERVAHNLTYDQHSFPAFPFTQNLVFAFKYYEYWGRTFSQPHPWNGQTDKAGNTLTVSGNLNKPLSCLMCEESYSYYETTTSACNQSSFGHDEWPWQRRNLFLQCAKTLNNSGDLPQDDDVVANGSTLEVNKNCSELPDLVPMITACENDCESRRAEFRQKVIQTFENACYAVGQCSAQNPNYITIAEIDAYVDEIIAECQSHCGITETHTPIQCFDAAGVSIHYCHVDVGTECELVNRDIATNWQLELFVSPAPGCPNTVPSVSPSMTPCPNPSVNETEVIQVSIPSNP
ncbi:DUF6443 domain-containing protein [Aureispira sp. CCB-QB1]|uniref:DUF6443 domain-containing protein n=1 Tax=Aureispira sp. CCB-QB1 TaxID=1313421 RepID=UPI000698AF26|nr:DUF6443 domain-containing protein [Aureispira sp. CCB-QB1]